MSELEQDNGAPFGPGSHEPSPTSGLGPTGFDPSRYEGKPRHLPKAEKRLLRALIDAVEERMALMTDREQTELLCGCLNVSPINCAWDEYDMAELIYPSLSHDVFLRDSDGSPKGRDAEERLDGNAATARAEGIAPNQGTSHV